MAKFDGIPSCQGSREFGAQTSKLYGGDNQLSQQWSQKRLESVRIQGPETQELVLEVGKIANVDLPGGP